MITLRPFNRLQGPSFENFEYQSATLGWLVMLFQALMTPTNTHAVFMGSPKWTLIFSLLHRAHRDGDYFLFLFA